MKWKNKNIIQLNWIVLMMWEKKLYIFLTRKWPYLSCCYCFVEWFDFFLYCFNLRIHLLSLLLLKWKGINWNCPSLDMYRKISMEIRFIFFTFCCLAFFPIKTFVVFVSVCGRIIFDKWWWWWLLIEMIVIGLKQKQQQQQMTLMAFLLFFFVVVVVGC